MQKIGGGVLYQYLQSVQAYIAPPITAVFLLGILWKRVNAKGAIATLLFGLLMATVRIISELMFTENGQLVAGASGPLAQFAMINFAHMAIYMFVACVIVCSVVSLATEKPSLEQIKGLTFGTLSAEQKAAAKNSFSKWDVIFSVILAAIVISILVYFRG
jgi:SSS family solute:Na+ symporter